MEWFLDNMVALLALTVSIITAVVSARAWKTQWSYNKDKDWHDNQRADEQRTIEERQRASELRQRAYC